MTRLKWFITLTLLTTVLSGALAGEVKMLNAISSCVEGRLGSIVRLPVEITASCTTRGTHRDGPEVCSRAKCILIPEGYAPLYNTFNVVEERKHGSRHKTGIQIKIGHESYDEKSLCLRVEARGPELPYGGRGWIIASAHGALQRSDISSIEVAAAHLTCIEELTEKGVF